MDVAIQILEGLYDMSLTEAARTINLILSLIEVPPVEDPNDDDNTVDGSGLDEHAVVTDFSSHSLNSKNILPNPESQIQIS